MLVKVLPEVKYEDVQKLNKCVSPDEVSKIPEKGDAILKSAGHLVLISSLFVSYKNQLPTAQEVRKAIICVTTYISLWL